MALHLYTDLEFIPKDMELIRRNDDFFNVYTSLQNDIYTNKALHEIEQAEYNSTDTFISRVKRFGALFKQFISTGTKTVLNIYYNQDKCFDIAECGDNAIEFLLRYGEGSILVTHTFQIPTDITEIYVNDREIITDADRLSEVLQDVYTE